MALEPDPQKPANDNDPECRKIIDPKARLGELIFLLKEDEEVPPFTPENNKLAYLLDRLRQNAIMKQLRKIRASKSHSQSDDQ